MTDFRRPLHDEPTPLVLAESAATPIYRRCFDDEIAIDFPSIRTVIDRMWTGLVGADLEPAIGHAAVSLSPRDALNGVTVPLELPVRRTCGLCGGRGESWAEPCSDCDGSGEYSKPHMFALSVPRGVADGTRFHVVIAPPYGLPTRIEVTVRVA